MDICLLNQEIARNGLTHAAVAKELGLSEAAFKRKLAKDTLGSEDADSLIRLLAIKNPVPIFFNNQVT